MFFIVIYLLIKTVVFKKNYFVKIPDKNTLNLVFNIKTHNICMWLLNTLGLSALYTLYWYSINLPAHHLP